MSLIKCPECNKEMSDEAKNCPNCGFIWKKSWYENKIIVILFLIFIFPLGLYGLWKSKNFGKTGKIVWTCIVGFFVLVAISGNEKDKLTSDTISNSKTHAINETAEKQKPNKEISNISFKSIRNKIEGMTEAQFNAYSKSITGKRIKWTGWVEDVNEKMFGGYELWIDMDSPSEMVSIQDITFNIPEKLAMKLTKNKRVIFEGDIESVIDLLGSCQISLENTKVISY